MSPKVRIYLDILGLGSWIPELHSHVMLMHSHECYTYHSLICTAGFKTGQTTPKSRDSLTTTDFKIQPLLTDAIDGRSSCLGQTT